MGSLIGPGERDVNTWNIPDWVRARGEGTRSRVRLLPHPVRLSYRPPPIHRDLGTHRQRYTDRQSRQYRPVLLCVQFQQGDEGTVRLAQERVLQEAWNNTSHGR